MTLCSLLPSEAGVFERETAWDLVPFACPNSPLNPSVCEKIKQEL